MLCGGRPILMSGTRIPGVRSVCSGRTAEGPRRCRGTAPVLIKAATQPFPMTPPAEGRGGARTPRAPDVSVGAMKVGIPRELKEHEYRVAITPSGVHELVRHGHQVHVEQSAGVGSS